LEVRNRFYLAPIALSLHIILGLKDPLRIITDMMEDKYLGYVASQDRGNFSKLAHGILDVIKKILI
jgi:hypothetical protein